MLSDVARGAKASWGYPRHWLDAWTTRLTISDEYPRQHTGLVAEVGGQVIGFAAVEIGGQDVELAHPWILPPSQGRGAGRGLLRAVVARVAQAGCDHVRLVADPHAVPFYAHSGAEIVEWMDASFGDVDRRLPVMRLPPGGVAAQLPVSATPEQEPSREEGCQWGRYGLSGLRTADGAGVTVRVFVATLWLGSSACGRATPRAVHGVANLTAFAPLLDTTGFTGAIPLDDSRRAPWRS